MRKASGRAKSNAANRRRRDCLHLGAVSVQAEREATEKQMVDLSFLTRTQEHSLALHLKERALPTPYVHWILTTELIRATRECQAR